MTVQNGSFETQATAAPTGEADQWTASEVYTAEEYAEFAADPGDVDTSSEETFDAGWYPPLAQEFVLDFSGGFFVDVDPALFDSGTQDFEDFENLWGAVLLASAGLQPAAFTPGGGPEDLESGWGATPLSTADVVLTFASFDSVPELFEDFEDEWGGLDLTLPGATFADFTENTSTIQVEQFETVRFDLDSVTVNTATDDVLRTAHLLVVGDPITFRNESGRLPEGLLAGAEYLVFGPTTNKFQVRATPTGGAVDIIDDGLGAHFVVHSPDRFWTDELTGV